jgi:hypothetical protein
MPALLGSGAEFIPSFNNKMYLESDMLDIANLKKDVYW